MILVDTSIWIDLLGRAPRHRVGEKEITQILITPPILQEILQGISNEVFFKKARDGLLAIPRVADPVTKELYLKGADLYRAARKRGLTIRSSIDCLIAAIALENQVPIWHEDRDFDALAKYTDLEVVRGFK